MQISTTNQTAPLRDMMPSIHSPVKASRNVMTRKLSPLDRASLNDSMTMQSPRMDKAQLGPSLGDYVSASPSLNLRNESRRNDVLSRSVAVTSARQSNHSGALEAISSAPAK